MGYIWNITVDALCSNIDIFKDLSLESVTPKAVVDYLKANADSGIAKLHGISFNYMVNSADYFSGMFYSDGGASYWGIIIQRDASPVVYTFWGDYRTNAQLIKELAIK